MKQVLIADPYFLTREGLTAVVKNIPGYHITQSLSSHFQIPDSVEKQKPDLLIVNNLQSGELELDIVMQSVNNHLNGAILYLSKRQTNSDLQILIKQGTRGIIAYDSSLEDLTHAISAVANGNSYFGNDIYQRAFNTNRNNEKTNLSGRELEILQLITKGMTTIVIADRLNVSVHTISTHRKNILKKLDLVSPAQLIAYAYENKLV